MTQIVGILNVTPDSFSDGGRYLDPIQAVRQAEQLHQQGADIIDIGAESTRPGGEAITPEQEWSRLEPVLKALSGKYTLSIDTRHPETVQKARNYNIEYLNDVTGLSNPKMIEAVKNIDAKLIIMHSLTVPVDKSITIPEDQNVIEVINQWIEERIMTLEQQGIAPHRLIIDPGIGFGKTAAQSYQIIHEIDQLDTKGRPLYLGYSRKSFLGASTTEEQDIQTQNITQTLKGKNIAYIRLHKVGADIPNQTRT